MASTAWWYGRWDCDWEPINGVAKTGSTIATGAATGLTSVLASASDPLGYMIDGLLREEGAAPATATTGQALNTAEARAEAMRTFAVSA